MSSKEHSDPKFRAAVGMQWKNIDKCIGDTIDRNNPDFSNYFEMESSEKRESYKRACWNSWIAPYNLQGFFMNFGDMLVKEGKPEIAILRETHRLLFDPRIHKRLYELSLKKNET